MPLTARNEAPPSPHMVAGNGYVLLAGALGVALVAVVAFAIGVGTVHVPVGQVLDVVTAHLWGDPTRLDPLTNQIVWDFRTPRVLLAAVAGAGLSLAGVCLQTLVRNPLADPYVFGVSAGASLGAVIALTAGSGAMAAIGVTGAAFAGSLASMVVVFAMAQRGSRLLGSSLVLAGVAIAYLGNALTGYIQLQADRDIVHNALSRVGMAWAANRVFARLSGGERQRVLVARALTQQTPVLLLDEPTNHLDIGSQHDLLDLVRELGLTTIAALHDLDHATAYCDHLVLLQAGRVVATGAPADVLTADRVVAVFGVRSTIVPHPLTGRPHFVTAPSP